MKLLSANSSRKLIHCLICFLLFGASLPAQDTDNDGVSDAEECEGTTSTLTTTGDFAAMTAANSGGVISLSQMVPAGPLVVGTLNNPVNTTLTFDRMGDDIAQGGCAFSIVSNGVFDDGLYVTVDGVVVLQFNATHWVQDADFRLTGKFNTNSNGGTWTPWTNEGNPVLIIDQAGNINLLVTNRNGVRENALDDMTAGGTGNNEFIINPAPLLAADCATGIDIEMRQSNLSGPGQRPAYTVNASVSVCSDSDGDGTPDFQDPCAPRPVAILGAITPEDACLEEDGSADFTVSGGLAGTTYTAEITNTSAGTSFTATSTGSPATFSLSGLTAGDYVADITDDNGICTLNQVTFTIGGEVTNTPARVVTPPVLWLRADRDVVTTGTNVTTWTDQSPATNNAVSDGSTVTHDFAGDVMNFNPGVRFDPAVDPLGRLVGEQSLGLAGGGSMDDFTLFIVPRITDPEGGNCGDDVFNFFDNEDLFEVENFVPKDGCEVFVNNFTYGVFNGGEQSPLNTENRDLNIIGLDYSAAGGAANFRLFGNGAKDLVNQINPYREPLTSATNPYSVGQAMLSRLAGDEVAPVEVGEILVYPTVLSAADRERVNTYLAIKYGIDLAHDYVDPNGNVLWDTDGSRSAFSSSVAGLGRDDCSVFEQRQSASSIQNTLVTIGNGEIATDNASNPNTAANDLSYLIWGHNGAQPAFLGQFGSANFANRQNRVYKVSEYVDGAVADAYQDLDIAFNRSNAELIGPDYTYALLIDRDGDGDFSNAEEVTGGVTTDGELVFEGVDLDHDDCFALARPTCSLEITTIIADCDNGDEFEITVDIEYTYFANSATTPGEIQVSVAGQIYTSDPLTDVTGMTSISFPVVGNFPQVGLIAEFTTDNLCSDSEFLNLISCDLACIAQPDAITGNIFPDYNLDGTRNVGEGSVPDVRVDVYDCDGNLVGSDVSGPDGTYSIAGLNPGDAYRVEFVGNITGSGTGTYVDPGNNLTNSDLRFVSAGACNLNQGVISPEFCEVDKLQFVTACFSRLNPAQNPGADALVSFLGSGGGNSNDVQDYLSPPQHPISVGIGEVGPVNGLAYDRQRQRLYAATTVKAETFFPAGGSIADVYVIDNSTNDRTDRSVTSATRLVNFDADCGISVGTYESDFNTPGGLDDGVDDPIFRDVGKVGIGDIDLGIGGAALYATNLFSRSLIVLPLDDDGNPLCGQSQEVAVPVPAECVGKGVVRPWAIGRRPGRPDMYVGAVCDASISGDDADLRVYVFRFDVATNTFETTPVLNASLDYPRQTNFANALPTDWLPWVDDLNDAADDVEIRYCCGNTYFVGHPQPILADIEFDRGDMVLGFMDRWGNQLSQIPSTSPKAFSPGEDFALPAGDMLRAGLNGDLSSWTLESGGMTNGAIAGPLTTQGATIDYSGNRNDNAGPGGAEFYYQDDYVPNSTHFETTLGGLALIPGQALAVNAWDPVRGVPAEFATGGVNFYNSTTGSWIKSYKLYGGVGPNVPGNFGKGAGFGDIEPICEPIRIQIGNYVFADTDEDGVQDACDTPIAGVPVALYSPDGTLLATTLTDAEGEYYFSGPSAPNETWVDPTDSLDIGDDIVIVFGFDPNTPANSVYDTDTDILTVNDEDYVLTLVDQETLNGGNDRADSDVDTTAAAGLPWDGFPFLTATLGEEQTNFTFDAGFIPLELDLALIKTIADATTPRMRGETVAFTITVVNQGTLPVRTVTISDYLSNGLSFNLAANQGVTVTQITGGATSTTTTFSADWAQPGANPSLPLTIPGTRGLAPEDTLRIPIFVELVSTSDLINERFVNRAEISMMTDLNGNDVSGDDVDSTPNDVPDDDAGGRLNTAADNALDGDGTGAVSGIFAATDEDDADPAVVPILDLAANKTANVSSLGPDGLASFGETIEFFLTVSNQGTLPVSEISLYDDVPCGYTAEDGSGNLLPANQALWTGNDVDGLAATFAVNLRPGQSVRRSVFLTLQQPDDEFCKLQDDEEPFTNSVEIASTRLEDGTLAEMDFDSNYDEDDDEEDGGGIVNDVTDNVVTGDGTGVAGDNDPATDDDDQDVANVDVIDVALRKYQDETQAATQTLFSPGETVKFQIALISQGNVPVDTFDVVDYLPEGLDYNAAQNDPLGWEYDPLTRRATLTGVPAAGITLGDSVRVCLFADVNNVSLDPADYVNRAEITRFYIDAEANPNLPGLPPLMDGYVMQDADSFQDDNPDNDPGGVPNSPDDDNVDGAGLNGLEDEDDADPAQVNVIQPVVIGDTTFIDVNMNGLQDAGDLPIGNVRVFITNADGTPVGQDALGNPYTDTLFTNADGFYLFDSLPPGNYVVTFDFSTIANPELYDFTGADAGANDGIDSDAQPDGSTPPTGDLMGGDTLLTVDAGLVCILDAEAGTADPICEDGTLDLTTLGASVTPASLGGQWSTAGDGTFNGGGQFDLATTYTPGAADIAAGSVELTLRNNFTPVGSGCTPDEDTFLLSINDLPEVEAGAPQTICEDATVLLAGTSGGGTTSVTWTTSGDGSFDDATSLTAVYTPGTADRASAPGTVTLTLSSDDPAGPCPAVTDEVVITLNDLPTVEAGPAQTVCENATVPLNGSFGGGATGTVWSTAGDGTFDSATEPKAVYTPGTADAAAGTVTLTLTTLDPAGPCPAVSDEVIITVSAAAATADAGSDQTVCVDEQVSLSGSAETLRGDAVAGSWSTNGNGTLADNGDGTATYDALSTEAGGTLVFTYTSTDLNGCGTVSDATLVTLRDAVASVEAGDDQTVCVDDPAALVGVITTAGGMTPTDGTWTITTGDGTLTDNGNGTATYDAVAGDIATDVVLTYTSADLNGCGTVSDAVTIDFEDAVETVEAGADQTVCVDDRAAVTGVITTVGGANPTDGAWTITTGGGTLTDNGDGTATYDAVAGDIATDVVLTYTSADLNGCGTVSDEVTIAFEDAVATVEAGADQTVCVDDQAAVTGVITTVGGANPTDGAWTITTGGGTLTDNSDGTATYDGVAGDIATDVVLTYTSADLNGCGTVSDAVTIDFEDAVATVEAGADQTVCVDDQALVTGVITTVGGANPTDGTWTITTGGGTLTDNGDGTATYDAVAGDIATDVVLTYTSADLNGCGTVSDAVTIAFEDAVATVEAGADQTVCVDDQAAVTGVITTVGGANPTDGAWTITTGGGTLTDNSDGTATYDAVAGDIATNVVLTYTSADLNGCGTVSDEVTINFEDAVATVEAGADQTVCVDDQALVTGVITTVGGANPTDGTWTITTGGGTLTDNGDGTATYDAVAGDIATNVVLTYTSANLNGCGTVSDEVTIDFEDAVATVEAGADQTVCVDDQAAVTGVITTVGGANPTDGTWTITTGGGTLTDNGDGTATYDAVAGDIATDVVLTYTSANLNGCGTVSDEVTIDFEDAVATVEAGADQTVCVDDQAAVTGVITTVGGANPTDGAWTITTGGGTLTDNGDGTATYDAVAGDIATDVVLTYTSADLNGCGTVSDAVTIDFEDAVATVEAGADQTVCVDDQAAVTGVITTVGGANPTDGEWTITTGGGTLTDNGDGTATYDAVAGDIATDVVLTYTSADLNGCGTVSDEVTIDFEDAVATVEAGADQTVCVDDQAVVAGVITTVGGANPTDGAWTITTGGGTLTDNGDGTATYDAVAGDIATDVVLTYTSADLNGCGTVSDEVTIDFEDAVETVEAGADQTVCVDDQAAVTGVITTVGGANPTDGAWTITTGGGTITDNGDGTATYDAVAGDIATDVVLTYTSADLNGCGTVSDEVTIDFEDAVATVEAGADQTACVDDQAAVTGVITTVGGANPTDGAWTITTGGGTITDNGAGTATYDAVAADANTTVVLTYTSADLNGCGTESDDVSISFNGLPAVTVADQTVCEEDMVTFTATTTAASGGTLSYQWQDNSNGSFMDIFNEVNQSLEISDVPLAFDGRAYRVIVTESANGIGCMQTAEATLSVNPLPPCVIDGPTTVAANQPDVMYSGPVGTFNYEWAIISGDATIDAGTEDDQMVTVDFGVMDVVIGLTVTDPTTGCVRSCQLTTGTANLSLGSTVFEDANNNGVQDPGEAGIPNVEVQLYDAATGNQVITGADGALGTADDAANGAVFTDADGFYFFDNLPPGDYIVRIPVSAFQPGADNALDSLLVSSNATSSGFMEIDPDTGNVDGDDNGLQPGGGGTQVESLPVTLSLGDEPVNTGTEDGSGNMQDDGPFDDSGNMTVDFGFFSPVLRVGDFVFVDVDGDGQQDVGEPGIGGVTVQLFNGNGTPVMFEADGTTPYPNTVTTAPDGSYLFEDLPPGDYFVTFDLSTADNAELYVYTTPNVGNDATDSDAVTTNNVTAQSATTPFLFGGEEDLTLDAGVVCNLSVTVADPFTICSTQPIDLTAGATITPASLGGFWTTNGDGTFLDANGAELIAPFAFGTAVTYRPGRGDARRGNVTLTLTTNDPGDLVPASVCEPVSASVTVEVLQVDCGSFFWDGGE